MATLGKTIFCSVGLLRIFRASGLLLFPPLPPNSPIILSNRIQDEAILTGSTGAILICAGLWGDKQMQRLLCLVFTGENIWFLLHRLYQYWFNKWRPNGREKKFELIAVASALMELVGLSYRCIKFQK
jgi:hypothetical protein